MSQTLLSKVLLFFVLAILAVCCVSSASATEYRAFWVDAWGEGVLSQSQVDTLLGVAGDGNSLGRIREANCNAVFIQMRRNCDALYPSSMGEPFISALSPAGFNALQAAINAAHDTTGGKKRIEVHAWIVTFRTSGGLVYTQHSSAPTGSLTQFDNYWPSRDNTGTEVSDKAFDPGHPLVEEYTTNVCMDLVNNFDIDGIHFDYIRFTGGNQGYNPTSIARYNARYGLTGQPTPTDDRFDQWRRDQVTSLVRKVYAKVQASKPNVKVSGSFVTWNPSPTASTRDAFLATRPYGNRTDGVFCDWDSWMQEGIVDMAVPMTYYNYATLPSDWTRWMNFIKDRKANRQALIGAGIYLNSLSNAILELQQTREPSPAGNYADGFCGYSYRVPYTSGTWAGFSPSFISQVTPYWDDLPEMPWKTNPTTGHVSGTVTDGVTSAWMDGATVSVAGPENRSMLTDGTGFYAFIDLTPGAYTVTVSMAGYESSMKTVDVAVGAVTGNMYVTDFALGLPQPPIISGVQASLVAETDAVIDWTTDKASTSQVEYGPTAAYGTLTTLNSAMVTSHSVAFNGLSPDTTYHYQVKSKDAAGSEAVSGDFTFTTPADVSAPSVPSGVNAAVVSETRVDVSWTASTDNVSIVGYHLYRDGVLIATTASTSYSNITCVPNTTYAYTVSAYDAAGNESSQSDAVSATTPADSAAPSVPAGLTAVAQSSTQVGLNWSASTDNIGVTGYKVFRNGLQIATTTTAAYSDATCQPDTSYSYTVSAFDAAGNNSAQSATASVTTPPLPDTQAPTVPTGVTAVAASATQVNVSWTASTDNVGVTGYKVFRNGVQIATTATTSYSDAACTPNTAYSYTVSAFDAAGNNSVQSSAATVTTPAGILSKNYEPTSVTLTSGTVTSGTVARLSANDASYLVITAAKSGGTRYVDWYSAVTIAESRTAVSKLSVTFDGKLSASLNQKLYLYNFATSAWVQMDSRTVGTSDATITWSTTSPLNYISTTGQIRLRQYVTRSSNFTTSSDFERFTVEYQ